MHWSFWEYSSIRRAHQLAQDAGYLEGTARHLLYGLLRIAESGGLAASQLTSQQVFDYLQARATRPEEHDPLPQIGYPKNTRKDGRAWLELFGPGRLGWRLAQARNLDPVVVQLELMASSGGERFYWTSDWVLLQELVMDLYHPVGKCFMRAGFYEAHDWLEADRPDSDRNRLEPVRPAPEPPLEDLIALLARTPSVSLIYWACGLTPPRYRGELTLTSLRWLGQQWQLEPGSRLAFEMGHGIVHPLHQFLTGLREPRYQLDFAYVSRQMGPFLDRVAEHRFEPASFISDEALAVLSHLSNFCETLNVKPTGLHLTWSAMRSPDPLLREALASLDVDRLESELERELFGMLPDVQLCVDGLRLGTTIEDFSDWKPISRSSWRNRQDVLIHVDSEDKVVRIRGRCLSNGDEILLDRETRPSQVERLLGIGRQNRWTPIYGGSIKVDTDQGMVEWVSLSQD